MRESMVEARCPRCRSKLGEIEAQEGRLFFVFKRGGYTWHVDGLGEDYLQCSCQERYRIKRRGDGFALIGENGSTMID